MPPPESISLDLARRIALAAQGFGAPVPGRLDRRHFLGAVRRMGLLQLDSVNVLVRSHYLPAFARLGSYDRLHLDEAAWGKRRTRTLFEYWGHEASLLPLELQPLFRWRMARAARGKGIYKRLALLAREHRPFIERIAAEVVERGPLVASELAESERGKGSWWGWSEGKRALEYLFWTGRVMAATRRNFERVYDVPERILPAEILAAPTPEEPEAIRALLRLAARAHGIGTAGDLRDYFRLGPDDAKPRLDELVEARELLPVRVEGWKQPAYLDPAARLPRRIEARALLSPFDPLIWERARTERLFQFRFRMEFYTPAHRREHGYYVLPFLMDDRLVARIDLKADRATRTLLARAAHAEEATDHAAVAAALATELRRMAVWLGLESVRALGPGDLMASLRRAVGSPASPLSHAPVRGDEREELSPGDTDARQGSAARGRVARGA